MTKKMVDKFLIWPLPEDFSPDGGISFKPSGSGPSTHCWPVGTNLFTADQAEKMFKYCVDEADTMVSQHTIETVSGKYVNVLDPNPNDILIEDIGWALSRISRFAGHTVTKIPYTVGQHSVFVSDLIGTEEPNIEVELFGLLHDAAEAFIGDIPSPVKHVPKLREVISNIEDTILNVIFKKFVGRLPTPTEWVSVKIKDKRAQFIEANTFMVSRGRGWIDRENHNISLIEMQSFPEPKASVVVYEEFMSSYRQLST